MCRKYVRGLLFVVGMSLLVGCGEAPQSRTTDAGVKQAVRESDENDSQKEETVYVAKTGDGYVCDVALGDDDKIPLRIKGTIEELDYDNVPVLKAVPSDREYDKDKIKSAFFDENVRVDELDDIEEYNEETMCDGESGGLNIKTSVEHTLHLEAQEQEISFTRYSDSSVFYQNTKTMEEYETLSNEAGTKKVEESLSEDYTFDMAWDTLKQKLEILGIENPKVIYYYGYSKDGVSYYEMEYTVPVGDCYLGTDTMHGDLLSLDAYGRASIGNKGIAYIQAENLFWDIEDESETVSVITPDELMKTLEEDVNCGDIMPSDDNVFDTVELMYMLNTEDLEHITMKPVWRVYMTVDEYVDAGGGGVQDIIIDAVSGELISVN